MNHIVFFISTLVLISIIYYILITVFCKNSKYNKDKWLNFIYINAITIGVNYYAFKGLSVIEKTEYSIAYPIGITVLMFFVSKVYEMLLIPSSYFLSDEDKTTTSPIPMREYKKVIESDTDKIAIYPRITIRDSEIENIWENEKKVKKSNMSEVSEIIKNLYNSKHVIFDSSDFVVINKTFGAFNNLQESFSQGNKFKFKDEELLTEKVQVDFMNIYDDYSDRILGGHTRVYEGKDTPYHIQIIVWVRRIK